MSGKSANGPVTFTLSGALEGAKRCVPIESGAAVAVVLVALRTASLPLAMMTGVGSVVVLRIFLPALA